MVAWFNKIAAIAWGFLLTRLSDSGTDNITPSRAPLDGHMPS